MSIRKKIWKYLKGDFFVWVLLKFVFSCYPGRYCSTSFGCRYCFLPWSTNIPREGEWNTYYAHDTQNIRTYFLCRGHFLKYSKLDIFFHWLTLNFSWVTVSKWLVTKVTSYLPASHSFCLLFCLSISLHNFFITMDSWILKWSTVCKNPFRLFVMLSRVWFLLEWEMGKRGLCS